MGLNIIDLDKKSKKNESEIQKTRLTAEEPTVDLNAETVEEQDIMTLGKEAVLRGKVVNIDNLRVRELPEGNVLGIITRNSIVNVLEDVDDVWFKIESPAFVGYVMKQFLMTFEDEVNIKAENIDG